MKIVKHKHATSRSISFNPTTGVLEISQPIDRTGASVDYYSNDEIFLSLEAAMGLKASKQELILKQQIAERTKELREIIETPVDYVVRSQFEIIRGK